MRGEVNARLVWQASSVLLGYPGEGFAERVRALPPLCRPLRRFARHAAGQPPLALAAHYVDTFDLRRRCCLYLTYYADGDTRRRGASLARLKVRYRSRGWELTGGEPPDFLPVVLEFAALDPAGGEPVLREHRAGLELLRTALRDRGSPYAWVVDAVCATLPQMTKRERERAAELRASGPPAERVGVTS
ncbi:nitrate reductase molybdenum cofactor assembly chaperone [Spongiactinospora sp. 9N601]|uniref:nitrate reductase molybdenum cofactor assembly chaperone n=1 Tax=Spongiactinospora sp. 9N601 TaxID=3375149 RepID=UPI0037B7F081